MTRKRSRPALPPAPEQLPGYDNVLTEISELLDLARRTTSQTINTILTAT